MDKENEEIKKSDLQASVTAGFGGNTGKENEENEIKKSDLQASVIAEFGGNTGEENEEDQPSINDSNVLSSLAHAVHLFTSSRALLAEISNSSVNHMHAAGTWKRLTRIGVISDVDVYVEFNALKTAPTASRPRRQVWWKPPDQGAFKINFDGAIFAGNNCSGLGVVVHDRVGLVIASMAARVLQQLQVLKIEALAACKAIVFAKELGLSKVVIEGDFSLVMSALNYSNPGLAPCGLLVQDALNVVTVLLLLLSLPHHSANAQSSTASTVAVNFNHSAGLVIGFLVWAFFFVAFFCIYHNDCVYTPAGPVISANRSSNCGLDRAVIETFPIFEVKNLRTVKVTATTLECAVCLGEFEDHETLRLLPKCSHAFHPDCIDAWLASHVTCPVCRAKLTNSDTTTTAATTTTTVESTESTQETGAVQNDHVVINVGDDPPRGKFLRSHSTGHSLSQPGVEINTERYTLILPEEVTKQKLRRSSSYDVVFCAVGSLRYTPPFVSIGDSASPDDQCMLPALHLVVAVDIYLQQ
nr:e3 ubiquitin-protein ligase atl6 [Quercus suber]